MKQIHSRREFIRAATFAGAGMCLATSVPRGWGAEPAFKTKLLKALIVNKPGEEELKKLKDAGFDGVEAGIVPPAEAEKCRAAADKLGMKIHAVLRGWAEFNSEDKNKVESTLETTRDALRSARAFGADAVLLVPCRIGGMKTPRPQDFAIDFDPATGHIKKVVEGDNAPYQAYIEAHNRATDTSKEAVKRLIPLAEECKVVIALENVWNNLWVQPAIFQNFVASFKNPWVKAYFDIGNHVKYAAPELWIEALGPLIAKCHVKDFKLADNDPGSGNFVDIRDGSVRWPVVRAALEKAGYSGWMTIEGGGLSPQEHSRRLDLIIAGK